jgi:hypothetical protein
MKINLRPKKAYNKTQKNINIVYIFLKSEINSFIYVKTIFRIYQKFTKILIYQKV